MFRSFELPTSSIRARFVLAMTKKKKKKKKIGLVGFMNRFSIVSSSMFDWCWLILGFLVCSKFEQYAF